MVEIQMSTTKQTMTKTRIPGISKVIGARGTSYLVRVELARDPVTGNRKQRAESFATMKAAETARVKWLSEIENGTAIDTSKMTTGEYLAHWLETYAKTNTRPTTYASYEIYAKTHLIPALGAIPLQRLAPAHLHALYAEKLIGGRKDGKAGGLSPRSVRYLHSIIREALQHAFQLNMVVRNVADAVQAPRVTRPPVKVWSAAEAGRFLAGAEGSAYAPVWRVLLTTGMRRGEVLGLRWQDCDLSRGIIAVRQTLVDVQGKVSFGEPKTKSGRRTITLDPATLAALKEHRTRQLEQRLAIGPQWTDYDLVFTGLNGNWIHPRNLARAFGLLVKKATLPYIPLHGLRHTSATLLLTQNIHPKVVSERLGHSSIGITLDTYSHVLPSMQREAADAIGLALAVTVA